MILKLRPIELERFGRKFTLAPRGVISLYFDIQVFRNRNIINKINGRCAQRKYMKY